MDSKSINQNNFAMELYPFKNHHLQLESGLMHYVDEGKGDVLLFIHGTPTWSFLYRDFIKHFSKTHRSIAIDHLGFGLSEKPEDFDGTPQSHSKNLSEFIEKLNLHNITLVVHDFGGPIGLAAAIQAPERFKRIIMFNTWLWETASNPEVQKVNKIVNSWIGKVLYLNFNFSPKVLLKKAFADKNKLTHKIHSSYIKPFKKKIDRSSLLKLAKSLKGSSDWYKSQSSKLEAIKTKPWLILWGTKDQFITADFLARWRRLVPNATVVKLNSGHFVQEEAPSESIDFIDAFVHKFN